MSSALERIWRRVLFLVGRGRVTLLDDTGSVQLIQATLSADEVGDGLPRLAEYGFQSAPPVGSDVIALFVAGERTNGVVIACGHQTYRMKGLAAGEVAISDDKGQFVYLSAAGIRIDGGGRPIEITNSTSVLIDSPTVHVTGDLQVDGSANVTEDISSGATITAADDVADQGGAKTMSGMRTAYDTHHHGASVGPTPLM